MKLALHNLWIWRAWHRLSISRPESIQGAAMPMGGTLIMSKPRPISWNAIKEWAQWHAYSFEETQLLDSALQAMDVVFIELWQERQAL